MTNYDLSQQTILPEATVDWVSNETATIYTFTLHTDIPWVSYQSVSERTIRPLEGTGHPRFVTAFVRTTPYAQHRWLITTPFSFTGTPWYDWAIDAEVQMKARNEN